MKIFKINMNGYALKKWMGYRLWLVSEADDTVFLKKCCGNDITKDSGSEPVASSAFARVYRFEFSGKFYYYKKFFSRNAFESFKNIVRGDRAARSLRGDLLLQKKGFNAPKCMMIGKKGGDVFMVTEAIGEGKDLIRYVGKEFSVGMGRNKILEKRNLCKLLGEQIGRLHAEGIIHGDLRWGNVVIEKLSPSEIRVWFLDNERTAGFRSISEKKRLVNLVQMNMIPFSTITFTDRMRFYIAYLSQNPDLIPHKKGLALKVLKKTAIRFNRKSARKNT
ncbi:MAG: lipopolysaccharide kinase InaA family protein [Desulfobacterales bacterium]